MTDERRVHEVLVKARNLIEREGWWGYCDDRSQYDDLGRCALGTLLVATDADPRYFRPARRELAAVIAPGVSIPDWNDAPGRTKAEVLAAFDRAIAATAPSPDLSFLSNPEQSPSLAEEVGAR